jgi:hypothetical protein
MVKGFKIRQEIFPRIVWSAPDSRIAPFCSICQAHIPENEVPVMVWDAEGACAQFCDNCVDQAIEAV